MQKYLFLVKGRALCAFLLLLVALTACKKDRIVDAPPSGNETERRADSLFLYAQQIYYWNDNLKATSYSAFNPRQYVNTSDEESGLNSELVQIVKLANGKETIVNGVPKYSYIFNTDDTNPSAPTAYVPGTTLAVDLEGNGNDIGILPGFYATNTTGTQYIAIVKAIYKGSPAAKAGLRRGDMILAIDGKTYGTTVGSNGIEPSVTDALYNNASVKLKFKHYNTSDNTAREVTLTKANYSSNPVYKDSVYTSGAVKVGYFALARFSDWEDNASAPVRAVFDRFTKEGISNVIVDLRYNGGGFTNTCQQIANLLAPTAANGKLMYTETYNETVSSKKATLLKNQPIPNPTTSVKTYFDYFNQVSDFSNKFNKTGGITGIQKLVFLVTGSTASSSELLINSLKPYVNDVKLVGETTYGKPIGFFPINIGKFEVYYSLFDSKNAKGEGGYYSGFTPDQQVDDIPTRDFGELEEPLFKYAYNYIQKGSFTLSTSATSAGRGLNNGSTLKAIPFHAPKGEFQGMVKQIEMK